MQISAAESHVMEALWKHGAMTPDEIVAEVAPAQGWGAATVKTLVNRLLKKGAIEAHKNGPRYEYRPAIQRTDYVEAESQGLLDRLFGGELTPLVTHFAKRRKLTPEDRARLRALIEELDEDD